MHALTIYIWTKIRRTGKVILNISPSGDNTSRWFYTLLTWTATAQQLGQPSCATQNLCSNKHMAGAGLASHMLLAAGEGGGGRPQASKCRSWISPLTRRPDVTLSMIHFCWILKMNLSNSATVINFLTLQMYLPSSFVCSLSPIIISCLAFLNIQRC